MIEPKDRLTFDGNFCDIAKCREERWGKYCPDGACSQRKVWERLADLESICSYTRLRELAEADKAGRLEVLPSNKALTNADRMRTATNQQLAKQLYDTQKELCRMLYKKLGFEDELNFSEDYSDILAWLNAPSKEAEKALEAME